MNDKTLDKISKLPKIVICNPLVLDGTNQITVIVNDTPMIAIKLENQDLYL